MAASWEMVVRDGVLARMLQDMGKELNPWDAADPPFGPPVRPTVCTFADVDSARWAYESWREVIDASWEWAALRLARWDLAQEQGVMWLGREEYEMSRFSEVSRIFGRSWRMGTPIADDHLRLAPVGQLTCTELHSLRTLLRDTPKEEILVPEGERLRPHSEIWVSQGHRA